MNGNFSVTGMSCAACSAHVEKAVAGLDGIRSVSVNLLAGTMVTEYDETVLSVADICRAVDAAGYGAAPSGNLKRKEASVARREERRQAEKKMVFRLIASLCFLIPLMYLSMGSMANLPEPPFLTGVENALAFAAAQLVLTIPVVILNRHYFISGTKGVIHGAPNMDTLVSLGAAASLIYGIFAMVCIGNGLASGNFEQVHRYMHDLYFESAAMILTLISVGKYMEARSKGKTSQAVEALIDMEPRTAVRLTEQGEEEIPAEEVRAGDLLLIYPGASMPADGAVEDGYSSVNESALTGESIPVEKSKGARVLSASVNGTGVLKVRAEHVGEDSTFSQMIRLVEEAGASKAPAAKLADRVSAVFVPTVMGIAVLAFLIWRFLLGAEFEFALSIGISVLVISCPCALGLATPVAIMAGTGQGARFGILIKSGEALESAGKTDVAVVDKTGTITNGKPVVTDIVPAGSWDETRLLRLAFSLERFSEHPLAEAVRNRCREFLGDDATDPVSDFEALPGRGVRGTFDGMTALAGNQRMVKEWAAGADRSGQQIDVILALGKQLSAEGKTPLYFLCGQEVAGVIAAADEIKESSREAVDYFRKLGIEPVMLTGDTRRTAEAVAEKVGIRQVEAEVLPQDKEACIRRLQEQGKRTAMVGDGVNDAPALVRADTGIAIGAGMDVAVESADIVLMHSDLTDAAAAIDLSRAVTRNIKQNLFWAFFYNSVGIPLAAGVFYGLLGWKLNPMAAAAAMSLSSFCVVTNALRLKWWKPAREFGHVPKLGTKAQADPLEPGAGARIEPAEPGTGSDGAEMKADTEACLRSTVKNENEITIKGETIKEREDKSMNRTMSIEGMMCQHCCSRVSKALNNLEGVRAVVDLERGIAAITAEGTVSDEALKQAVTDAGYEVTGIKNSEAQ